MNKYVLAALVATVGLVGCATQRPQMPEEVYVGYSQAWAYLHLCNKEGWLDIDTTARGRSYIQASANQYSFDPIRMGELSNNGIKNLPKPSQDFCREAAIKIAQRKQQIEVNNAQVVQQERDIQNALNNSKSTQTYCNKIGNQVMCSSF